MMLTRMLINEKKLDEAARHLNDFLARNPKNQEAWYLLGKTYLQLSENALKKINEIDPDSVVAHEIAGEIDESMHNYDLALVEYKKAVDMAPSSPALICTWAMRIGTLANGNRRRPSSRPNSRTIPTTAWRAGSWRMRFSRPTIRTRKLCPNLNAALERCPTLMQARVDRARAW